ncbi:MAG: dTMP kinase [Deltaproteobacteria bacterium]|nr:dTMP kinase [Deltaproteobacteria bacterium]
MKKGPGRFIVLEGSDGAGTTTQAAALKAVLEERGHKALVTCEPSTGWIGKRIREELRGAPPSEDGYKTLALLFAADRLHHVATEIQPALEEGVHVLCDRYLLSSLVYQGLHVDEDWVRALNREAQKPDVTFVLDVGVETSLARQKARGAQKEIYDDTDSLTRIQDRYLKYASDVDAVLVDGEREPRIITKNLLEQLLPLVDSGAQ